MKTQISVDRWGGKRLIRVLALLLAFAVAPPMLRAQVLDPTGAWLIKWYFSLGVPFEEGILVLNVFHQGGTLTGDVQGESAFDPHATIKPKSPLNVISSPQSGVWKAGPGNTFEATFWVIAYEVQTKPPGSPLFQLSKVHYTGSLIDPDQMEFDVTINHYNSSGDEINIDLNSEPLRARGVRIPLKGLPSPMPIPTPTPN